VERLLSLYGGEFGSGHTLRDMWTRPDPGGGEMPELFEYALTVDGYFYADAVLHEDLKAYARVLERKWRGRRRSEMDFVELRLLLFWEQRCAHWNWQAPGSGPTKAELRDLHELHEAICGAWEREWPKMRPCLEEGG